MSSKPDEGQHPPPAEELRQIASGFVRARLAGESLSEYPGAVPSDLNSAYLCQDMAIDLWPDQIGGWKVGRIRPSLEQVFDSDRLAGPVFEKGIHYLSSDDTPEAPVFRGGFAAIEAEFIAVVNADAPESKTDWTLEETAQMIRELRVGMEIASSPLATLNELGPAVVVSDFGNNAGLIVGAPIHNWRIRALESLTCETFVDGRFVGRGGAHLLSGGPVRSVQFMLQLAAERGRPLRAGQVVATGQTSGIHEITPGQSARIAFSEDGEVRCRLVAARGHPTR
jgi:2-keto-4-pentenoate hydratase